MAGGVRNMVRRTVGQSLGLLAPAGTYKGEITLLHRSNLKYPEILP
jgi:hypothetical protein